jgi:pimeloyl-ACP methyl ester carboxylesterase
MQIVVVDRRLTSQTPSVFGEGSCSSSLWKLLLFTMILVLGAPAGRFVQAQPADAKKKPPAPKEEVLRTSDGVDLATTYYGSLKGKDAVPVILLHGYKGSRGDFNELALALQAAGCAVIVPDLRGHGDSTRMERGGSSIKLDASKLRKEDFMMMFSPGTSGGPPSGDLEAIKRFLMHKNNAGELNIEKLCVVGAEMGATIAINWAAADWSWPPLLGGKQGQDVKALVLISPQWSFKGVPITQALNSPAVRQNLSIMMIAGSEDAASTRDATRIYKIFEKHHTAAPQDDAAAAEQQDLFFDRPETPLRGTELLSEKAKSLALNPRIAKFIELRLIKKKFPWSDRAANKSGKSE